MTTTVYMASADLCRAYREDGYITFGDVTSEGNYLESVVGISLQDARDHLDDCVLYGRYDMCGEGEELRKPTKVPPANYVAELRPLVEAQKAAEAALAAVASEESPSVPPQGKKAPKAKKAPQYNGKARRTVHAIDVHVCDSVFHKLATSPSIGEMVGKLTGWADEGVGVRLLETQVWMKPPRCTVPLAFHRDTPYFGFLAPLDICTVWFTFDDVSTVEKAKALGGLEYASGSHFWSQLGGIEGVFFDRDYRSPMKKAAAEHALVQERDAKRSRTEGGSGDGEPLDASPACSSSNPPTVPTPAEPQFDIHYVTAPAGGVSFHNGMLWHGSGANLSDTCWRRGIGIHYIRADAQFKPEYCAYDEVPSVTTGNSEPAAAVGPNSTAPEAPATAAPKKPYLSAMWAPHKQQGSLLLSEDRFPVIWQPVSE